MICEHLLECFQVPRAFWTSWSSSRESSWDDHPNQCQGLHRSFQSEDWTSNFSCIPLLLLLIKSGFLNKERNFLCLFSRKLLIFSFSRDVIELIRSDGPSSVGPSVPSAAVMPSMQMHHTSPPAHMGHHHKVRESPNLSRFFLWSKEIPS